MILGIVSALLSLALLLAFANEIGYQKGCKKGRTDEMKWWLEAEEDVDQARVKFLRRVLGEYLCSESGKAAESTKEFMNRLNSGNPNYTPYQTGEK